ncbi:MAG: alpha/beta hydrolase [Intrasporangium sp.]|uniref:alpha/beta fold hydrolase n=1 Tax=Intrasporangium sp. TaxID=1925024 RepID=UPI0026491FDB|nr:alpha/beta hydrolase [Intrasporangium sp.]MDN5797665.1 alpha/beta hydrolase [Intrasporangium sp.]
MPPTSDPQPRPRPLVLLHGIGQSPIAWQEFVSAFGAGRVMHAPWMRGLRPSDAVGFDLDAAAVDVANQLELQGMKQVDLLGVSVGGNVALRLAVERPELARRLVLAGALVRPTKAQLRMQKLALRIVPEGRLVDAGVSRARMLAVFDALRTLDATSSLAQVQAPALVVAGSGDRLGRAAAEVLARGLPNARLELVARGSSMLNDSSPKELAALAHAFLDPTT